MALRYAVANGNWSNTATWDGGTLPTAADDVFANNFTVTIDGTFTVLTIRTTANTTPAITAGGIFTFANGGDLTCTASNGIICRDVGNVSNVTFDLPSPSSATLRASVNFFQSAVGNSRAISVQNTGTFNMVGDYNISSSGNSFNRATIQVAAGNPTINIVGNITNSSSQPFNLISTIWINGGTPTINITGNVGGSFLNVIGAGIGNGIYSQVNSTINITGNVITNLAPSIYLVNGNLNVIGNVNGGISHPAIFNGTSAATIDLLGITTSGTNRAAVEGITTTLVRVRGNVVNTNTYSAIYAGRVVIDSSVISWQFKDSTNTITRTLYTVVGVPATSDVRFGTTYGGSSELTGTLRVPTAANVLSGVLVDNTTGTLLMTPADFWNYLIASGFTADSIGDRLQNVSTVATTGGQIASYNI
jgi:hypothetical protein